MSQSLPIGIVALTCIDAVRNQVDTAEPWMADLRSVASSIRNAEAAIEGDSVDNWGFSTFHKFQRFDVDCSSKEEECSRL